MKTAEGVPGCKIRPRVLYYGFVYLLHFPSTPYTSLSLHSETLLFPHIRGNLWKSSLQNWSVQNACDLSWSIMLICGTVAHTTTAWISTRLSLFQIGFCVALMLFTPCHHAIKRLITDLSTCCWPLSFRLQCIFWSNRKPAFKCGDAQQLCKQNRS